MAKVPTDGEAEEFMNKKIIEINCIEQIDVQDDSFFFCEHGDEKYILKDGIIRRNAYRQILNVKSYAEEFLSLIRSGELELDWQTQCLVLLDHLSGLIKGGNWNYRDLANLFREAMIALQESSAHSLSELQHPGKIRNSVEDGFSYNEFDGAIFATVAYARRAAVQGMIREFAEQYGAEGGYKGDLYGSYRFCLTNPRVDGIAQRLVHSYMEGEKVSVKIAPQNDGTDVTPEN